VKSVSISGDMLYHDGIFEAVVEVLELSGSGESTEEAQDELIERFINWIQEREGQGDLEERLARAGYPGVDESTELVLEFRGAVEPDF
jgi:ABC-type thiamine transport system substrate-binding protein